MVAGIIFQLCTMAIFVGCGIDFAIRAARDKPWAFRVRRIAAAQATTASTLTPTPSDSEKGGYIAQAEQGDLGKWRKIMAATFISSTMILLRGE
jgi:hypothetical protein